LIDIHVHLWDWDLETPSFIREYMLSRGYFGERDPASFFSLDALLHAMDEADVGRAALLPLRAESYQWIVSNDYVAEQVARAPDRLIGFAGVSPGAHAAQRELQRAIEDLGLRGLKLHPPMQMFDPGDPICFDIYAQMQAYDLPILFHTGSGPTQLSDRYSNPHLVDEVAVHFPELKIVLAHAGRVWYQETLSMMRRHPNIYVDISATVGKALGHGLMLALLVAIKEVVGDLDRVLFASDYPWYTPMRMRDLLQRAALASRALPEPLQLTALDVEKISAGNARRLLHIDTTGDDPDDISNEGMK
jgi:predicted TIM-barrel fold metal-dependent hydrolase